MLYWYPKHHHQLLVRQQLHYKKKERIQYFNDVTKKRVQSKKKNSLNILFELAEIHFNRRVCIKRLPMRHGLYIVYPNNMNEFQRIYRKILLTLQRRTFYLKRSGNEQTKYNY